ncbi:hypothetical protein C8R46DRAFT_1038690 [Mycena filopes]|nr:hypothetical protein C8R46DRAFT_1038690 [Mycena filopes]
MWVLLAARLLLPTPMISASHRRAETLAPQKATFPDCESFKLSTFKSSQKQSAILRSVVCRASLPNSHDLHRGAETLTPQIVTLPDSKFDELLSLPENKSTTQPRNIFNYSGLQYSNPSGKERPAAVLVSNKPSIHHSESTLVCHYLPRPATTARAVAAAGGDEEAFHLLYDTTRFADEPSKFLPVYYAGLAGDTISNLTAQLRSDSDEQDSIHFTTSYLFFCLDGTRMVNQDIPPAASADLWTVVWPFIQFLDCYQEVLVGLEAIPDPHTLYALFIPLICAIQLHAPAAALIETTPGFRILIFRILAVFLESPEINDEADALDSLTNPGTISDVYDHADDELRDALFANGIVQPLTAVAYRLTAFPYSAEPELILRCLARIQVFVQAGSGYTGAKQLLRGGVLKLITDFADLRPSTPLLANVEHPVTREILQHLRDILRLLQNFLVYFSILSQVDPSLDNVTKDLFNDYPLWDAWKAFWSVLQERRQIAKKFLAPDTRSKSACDNVTIPIAHILTSALEDDVTDLSSKDRAFLRAILDHDYQRFKNQILLDQVQYLRSTPEAHAHDTYTWFDYSANESLTPLRPFVRPIADFRVVPIWDDYLRFIPLHLQFLPTIVKSIRNKSQVDRAWLSFDASTPHDVNQANRQSSKSEEFPNCLAG